MGSGCASNMEPQVVILGQSECELVIFPRIASHENGKTIAGCKAPEGTACGTGCVPLHHWIRSGRAAFGRRRPGPLLDGRNLPLQCIEFTFRLRDAGNYLTISGHIFAVS